MNEQEQLAAVRYRFDAMKKSVDDRESFKYEVNSFLVAARSVLQYACKETQNTPDGKRWYDASVSSSELLRFFKCARNRAVHVEPVRPELRGRLRATEPMGIAERVTVIKRNPDGSEEVLCSSDPQTRKLDRTPPSVSLWWVFDDWSGPEDVIELASRYLDELDAFVHEGMRKGFITG